MSSPKSLQQSIDLFLTAATEYTAFRVSHTLLGYFEGNTDFYLKYTSGLSFVVTRNMSRYYLHAHGDSSRDPDFCGNLQTKTFWRNLK